MSIRPWLALAGLCALVSSCDRPSTTAPGGLDATPSAAPINPESARLERLARRLALALRNHEFRARVRGVLRQSRFAEQKVHFQRLLGEGGGDALRVLARESGDAEAAIAQDAELAGNLELYLPVAGHRDAWQGEAGLLVATALRDGDTPVAFDLAGGRHELNPDRPPVTPVLALVPAEVDFGQPVTPATCTPSSCGGGGGGGSPPPGLYMTLSHFTSTYEGWLKGNPEFEVHVLGQSGQTDSLTSYQCSGERSGGVYYFDQNKLDWSGSVLLFSQVQLDSYRQQHPGQSIRVFVVEDDDTACQIRSSGDTFDKIIAVVDAAYNALTGGKDSTAGLIKIYKRAGAFQKLWRAVGSLINTNDELVGNAVEDVVAGEFHPGANWVVKGADNITTGWVKLEMK